MCVCACMRGRSLWGLQSNPNASLVIWLLLVLLQQEGSEKICSGLTDLRTTATHSCDMPAQEWKCSCATLIMNNLWFTPASTSVQWLTADAACVYAVCQFASISSTKTVLGRRDGRQDSKHFPSSMWGERLFWDHFYCSVVQQQNDMFALSSVVTPPTIICLKTIFSISFGESLLKAYQLRFSFIQVFIFVKCSTWRQLDFDLELILQQASIISYFKKSKLV